MGQQDYSEKDLCSYPDVFADIFNTFVYDGKSVIREENLQPRPTGGIIVNADSKLKELGRDACMEDVSSGIRYLILGIENQQDLDYTMPLRIMGYDYVKYEEQIRKIVQENKSKGIHAGVHKILEHQKLIPVVTLVLHYGPEKIVKPEDLLGMLKLPESEEYQPIIPYIQNYKMNLILLNQLTKEQLEKFKSDFKIIAKYVNNQYNSSKLLKEFEDKNEKIIHVRETLYVLRSITKDDRFLNILKNGDRAVEGGIAVCDLLDIVENRGVEKGIEQGIQALILDNIEEGVAMERIILKLQKRFLLSEAQAEVYWNKYGR